MNRGGPRTSRYVGVGAAVVALLTAGITALAMFLTATPGASAAALTEVTGFGANPGGLRMYVYVPDGVAARPGVLVAMHGCNGWAPSFHQGTEFASLADRYGFVVIYPQANKSANGLSNCFDVWSAEALRHGGGSDPVSIVSMTNYVLQRYNGDPGRVFATGFSSGAMETLNLLATYPDVFQAGRAVRGGPVRVPRSRGLRRQDPAAVGRPGQGCLSRLHRAPAEGDGLARHRGQRAAVHDAA